MDVYNLFYTQFPVLDERGAVTHHGTFSDPQLARKNARALVEEAIQTLLSNIDDEKAFCDDPVQHPTDELENLWAELKRVNEVRDQMDALPNTWVLITVGEKGCVGEWHLIVTVLDEPKEPCTVYGD